MNSSATLLGLRKVAEQVSRNAQRLAISVGNFHGTNDFAFDARDLWNGFILDDLQRDLTAIIVVRAYALLAPSKDRTDATLKGAFNLVATPGMKDVIAAAARKWIPEDVLLGESNERIARRRTGDFLKLLPTIDTARLKKHRDWVVAHSTTKKAPAIMMKEVWEAADAVLLATDHLTFFALGRDKDLRGLSEAYGENSAIFWRRLFDGDRP